MTARAVTAGDWLLLAPAAAVIDRTGTGLLLAAAVLLVLGLRRLAGDPPAAGSRLAVATTAVALLAALELACLAWLPGMAIRPGAAFAALVLLAGATEGPPGRGGIAALVLAPALVGLVMELAAAGAVRWSAPLAPASPALGLLVLALLAWLATRSPARERGR